VGVDSESLRLALVEGLCRRQLISTPAVREAFLRVPRERFLPELTAERGLETVYRDDALVTKMSEGVAVSSSSQPAIMALMLERLQLSRDLRVLEIGAGTGYNAALLAELAGRVVAIDVDAEVALQARRHLADGGHAVEVVVGDGMAGWPAGAPYDRIVVTATPPFIPSAWRDQLRPGGLLEVPMLLGHGRAAAHVVVTFRREDAELVSVAVVPGAFMGFRGQDGRPPAPVRTPMGWHDSAGRRAAGGSLFGPGLAHLRPSARRRLLSAALSTPRRSVLGRGADTGLFLHLVCTAPGDRLVGVLDGGDQRLGLVDAAGGLAVLHFRWRKVEHVGVTGLEAYGEPGAAERDLRGVVAAWRALGRPRLADFEVRVAFGRRPGGSTWLLPAAGGSRVGVSVGGR
jgi:protein-L-isoaspartate(D-aspartate) O-methyltransferase